MNWPKNKWDQSSFCWGIWKPWYSLNFSFSFGPCARAVNVWRTQHFGFSACVHIPLSRAGSSAGPRGRALGSIETHSYCPFAQKIKAKRRLVKNCADRNLIGWDEKKWQWAVNIAVSLTVMEELFRVFISVKAAVTHCQDTRLSKSPAMKMLPL